MSQTYTGCYHENRTFIVIYKNGESTKLLCKLCLEDPDLVNDSVVDMVLDIETGEKLQ